MIEFKFKKNVWFEIYESFRRYGHEFFSNQFFMQSRFIQLFYYDTIKQNNEKCYNHEYIEFNERDDDYNKSYWNRNRVISFFIQNKFMNKQFVYFVNMNFETIQFDELN